MKRLLVVVDMQKDFIDGALGTKEAVSIVPAVAERVRKAQADGEAVVFTLDTHHEDYLTTQEGRKLPVEHCILGTEGWQLDRQLQGFDGKRFEKPTFGSIELANWVQAEGFEEITLIGLCTDICVISNAMLIKAALPESRVIVDGSCCAGVTPESHERALKAMQPCQIEVI